MGSTNSVSGNSMENNSGVIQVGDGNAANVTNTTSAAEKDIDLIEAGRTSAVEAARTAPIFISHCHDDHEIVTLLLELLQDGLGLGDDDIFATGQLGTTIDQGEYWLDVLKKRLQDAQLVIVIVTPAYLTSDFCMIELGALWSGETPRIPLMVRPADFGNVGAVLGSMQLSKIDDENALNAMRDRVVEAKDLSPDTSKWERKRSRFLAEIVHMPGAAARTVKAFDQTELANALEDLKAEG